MPSIAYMNQSAPFWDFVASLEQEGRSHPFFGGRQPSNDNDNNEEGPAGTHPPPHPPFGPWGWGRGFPFRGPPPHEMETDNENQTEKEKENEKDKDNNDNGEGPSNSSDEENCARGRGRHGRCGKGRRGGRHGFGHHGPYGYGPHGPHGHHHRGRGGWGPWGWGGRGGFNPFNFAAGLFDPTTANKENDDFTPEADIFDTESSFVIHVSLPGAKKEDVGVNWDAEKSELSIAGVIYRPGDEAFIKTLEMGERKVGPFERRIRLGTRANPAQVDADGISAKLEDGVLRVEVPKLETGFVEIRKVDIE